MSIINIKPIDIIKTVKIVMEVKKNDKHQKESGKPVYGLGSSGHNQEGIAPSEKGRVLPKAGRP